MGIQELPTQCMYPLKKIQFQVVVKHAVEGGGVLSNMLEPAEQEGKPFWGEAR